MVSRARIAAAACVMAFGLLVGSAGITTAVADTGSGSGKDDTSVRRADKTPRPPRASGDTERAPRVSGDTERAPRASGSVPREVKVRSGRTANGENPGDDPEDGTGGGGEPRPPCCESGSGDCGGDLVDPRGGPTSDGEYGEHRPETVPPGRPMPPLGGGGGTVDVLDIVPGIGANDATHAPINVPIIVARPVGIAPGVSPAGGVGAGSPAAPRHGTASSSQPQPQSPTSQHQPLPAPAGGSAATPASAHRVGYSPQLRGAGTQQVAALALPGLAGILILTGAGGLVGYRQAKAGQHLRPRGITRFMN